MTRSGSLVLVALVLGLVAAGVLFWTDFLDLSRFGKQSPAGGPSASDVDQWVARMTQTATPDGIVASFSDSTLFSWSVTDGHRIERFSLSDGLQGFARLSSAKPLDPEDRLSGLQLRLPAAWSPKVNGKKIEVGVVARQPLGNAAKDISVLYATLQAGNSGWHTFNLSPQFEVQKFIFEVPLLEGGYTAQPLVVVRSDASGGDKAVEIVGVYVKPAPN